MSESQSTKTKSNWYDPIVDWLKFNSGSALLDLIMKYGGNYVASIAGGFYGWILKTAFKYVVLPFLKHAKNHILHVKEGKEELAKLTEVTSDPTKTNTEVVAAEDDFFTRP
jgi:hypothetical protein